jgi:hypothetical protein
MEKTDSTPEIGE